MLNFNEFQIRVKISHAFLLICHTRSTNKFKNAISHEKIQLAATLNTDLIKIGDLESTTTHIILSGVIFEKSFKIRRFLLLNFKLYRYFMTFDY
jgi:hypothetical protein